LKNAIKTELMFDVHVAYACVAVEIRARTGRTTLQTSWNIRARRLTREVNDFIQVNCNYNCN